MGLAFGRTELKRSSFRNFLRNRTCHSAAGGSGAQHTFAAWHSGLPLPPSSPPRPQIPEPEQVWQSRQRNKPPSKFHIADVSLSKTQACFPPHEEGAAHAEAMSESPCSGGGIRQISVGEREEEGRSPGKLNKHGEN